MSTIRQTRNKQIPFRLLKSRMIYKNPWISVREDKVLRPDGKKGIFGVVTVKPGVGIVALDKKECCFLIKEYEYAHNKFFLQIPGGAINPKETPLRAAKRELLEETGLVSDKWRYLGPVHYYTAVLHTIEHIFLAQGVQKIKEPDAEERKLMTTICVPFQKAVKLAAQGNINLAESVSAIFRANYYLKHSNVRQKKTGGN